MKNFLLALLSPKCTICGQRAAGLCPICLSALQYCRSSTCVVCNKPSLDGRTHIDCFGAHAPFNFFCAFLNEGIVKDVIDASNYRQKEFYSLKVLSIKASDYCSASGYIYLNHLVVPMPLSKAILRERGYNQNTFIARSLCDRFSISLNATLLSRAGGPREVTDDLSEAFVVNGGERLVGKQFLLVSDTYEAGDSFLKASEALYLAGAQMVNCFALSKKVL